MSTPETFNAAMVRTALIGTRFGANLRHFSLVESTNTLLLAAGADGAADGTVYLADEQTAGRGRGGHGWHSAAAEGLYVSALVRSPLRLREALWLSLVTGLAARTAILSTAGVTIDLRWPNDLMVESKKLGGILVETAVEPNAEASLRYAVIGVGINLNQEMFPGELGAIATSLRMVTGVVQRRTSILVALLRALDFELGELEAERMDVLERFGAASSWVHGKRVQVPEQGGYTGMTVGLDKRGFLLVDAEDGMRRTVLSGGVREAL
jgi:BirA family biotin operon repressor/biotin-[acetyl-CoA-carboxylase] ligase